MNPYIYVNITTQTAPPSKPQKARSIFARSTDDIDDDVIDAICGGVTDWWGIIRTVRVTEDALAESLRRLMLEREWVGCRIVPDEHDRHGCERREYFIKEMA
jgi:hypothetical protein